VGKVEVLNAVERKFRFSIVKVKPFSRKKSSQEAEIYAGRKKFNFPIPAYL
jgi:hypothetical protein